MINNFEVIKSFLNFESEDDFYFLQIIKRKKENIDLHKNSVVIKSYYIDSKEHLEKIKGEIIMLCKINNARAYIHLNKRSFEKVGLFNLKNITELIISKDYKAIKNSYDSVCGRVINDNNKKWVIDIDEDNPLLINRIVGFLKTLQPYDVENKLIGTIPTKNGIHLVTSPFNLGEFKDVFKDIEVHKNSPTLLYIYE